jgi:hypothetical protein
MPRFWEYEDNDAYNRRASAAMFQPPAPIMTRPSSSPMQAQGPGLLPPAPTLPSPAPPSYVNQGWTPEPTFGQRVGGAFNTFLDVINAPANYVGKPLLGAISAAVMPGQQISYDKQLPWYMQLPDIYQQWQQTEEQRKPLFEFQLGPINVSEKWFSENILADPLFWLGIGAASKTAKGLKALGALNLGDDALRLAAQGSFDDVLRIAQGLGKADDVLPIIKGLRTARTLDAIDMATSPFAWPGAVGKALTGGALGAAGRRAAEDLTPSAKWVADLLQNRPGLRGAAEITGRAAELGGWGATLGMKAAMSPISIGSSLIQGQPLGRAVSGAFDLPGLAEGLGLDRWLQPALEKAGEKLMPTARRFAAEETGAFSPTHILRAFADKEPLEVRVTRETPTTVNFMDAEGRQWSAGKHQLAEFRPIEAAADPLTLRAETPQATAPKPEQPGLFAAGEAPIEFGKRGMPQAAPQAAGDLLNRPMFASESDRTAWERAQEEQRQAAAGQGRMATIETREPWQMTREEWETQRQSNRRQGIETWNQQGAQGFPPTEGIDTVQRRIELAQRAGYSLPQDADKVTGMDFHRLNVEAALAEGKPVPPEVLAEYPDLAQPTPTTPTQEATVARPETMSAEPQNVAPQYPAAEVAQQEEQRQAAAGQGRMGESKPLEPRRTMSDAEWNEATIAARDWQYLTAKAGRMATKTDLDYWLMKRYNIDMNMAHTIANYVERFLDFQTSDGVQWNALAAKRPEPRYEDYPDIAPRGTTSQTQQPITAEPSAEQPNVARYWELAEQLKQVRDQMAAFPRYDPRQSSSWTPEQSRLWSEQVRLEKEMNFHRTAVIADEERKIAAKKAQREAQAQPHLESPRAEPVTWMADNAADLAADYKARGMERRRAWDQFVIDRGLKPEMPAREFYSIYDRVTPSLRQEGTGPATGQMTHIVKQTFSDRPIRVRITEDQPGYVAWVDELGGTGGTPRQHIESITPIAAQRPTPTTPPQEATVARPETMSAEPQNVAPQYPAAEVAQQEAAPSFAGYDDARKWIDAKAKEYGGKRAFYASEEYKAALPEIQKLYELEIKDYQDKAAKALKEAGVAPGDRVYYDYVNPFGATRYSGIVTTDSRGLPRVKLDAGQVTASGAKSVAWHKGWRRQQPGEAMTTPRAEEAPAPAPRVEETPAVETTREATAEAAMETAPKPPVRYDRVNDPYMKRWRSDDANTFGVRYDSANDRYIVDPNQIERAKELAWAMAMRRAMDLKSATSPDFGHSPEVKQAYTDRAEHTREMREDVLRQIEALESQAAPAPVAEPAPPTSFSPTHQLRRASDTTPQDVEVLRQTPDSVTYRTAEGRQFTVPRAEVAELRKVQAAPVVEQPAQETAPIVEQPTQEPQPTAELEPAPAPAEATPDRAEAEYSVVESAIQRVLGVEDVETINAEHWQELAQRLDRDIADIQMRQDEIGQKMRVDQARGGKDQIITAFGKEMKARVGTRFGWSKWNEVLSGIRAEARDEISAGLGRMLRQAGMSQAEIDATNMQQRLRLVEEIANRDVTQTKGGKAAQIDGVTPQRRQELIAAADDAMVELAQWIGMDPTAVPGIELPQKQMTRELVGKLLEEPDRLPISDEDLAFLQRHPLTLVETPEAAPIDLRADEAVRAERQRIEAEQAAAVPEMQPQRPAPEPTTRPGSYRAEQYRAGLNASSTFEGGEVRPDEGYAWRSMGEAEYQRTISGKPFGQTVAKRGGFWSWFPGYSARLKGNANKPKYLVEVRIPAEDEGLTRPGTIEDITGIWKSTGGDWERVPLPEAKLQPQPATSVQQPAAPAQPQTPPVQPAPTPVQPAQPQQPAAPTPQPAPAPQPQQPAAPTPPPQQPPAGGAPPPPPNVVLPQTPGDDLGNLRDGLYRKTQPWMEKLRGAGRTIVQEVIDRNDALQEVEQATGIPTHKLAQIVPGAVGAGEANIERYVRPQLDKVGDDIGRLEEYMVAMRMSDLKALNPNAALPGKVQDPDNAIAQLRAELGPERMQRVEDAAAELWRLNDELVLKPYLDEGIISQEAYDAIKTRWPHYVPFYRQDYAWEEQFAVAPGRQEADMATRVLKTISEEGSEKALDEPLARWQAQIIHAQSYIARNKAARTLVNALEQYGGQQMVRRGVDQRNVYRGTVRWHEGGQIKVAQVPAMYERIAKGMDAESAGVLARMLAAPAKVLRVGAVQANPGFLIPNTLRDLISAWMKEGLTPFSPYYINGWRAALSKNDTWYEASQAGALMSGMVETARRTDELRAAKQLGGIKVNNVGDALLLLPRLIMKANEVSEQATRLAVWDKLKAQGLDDLDAAVRTRDVTVDFSKSGHLVKALNMAIPFLNAGVQGAANTVKLLKDDPKTAMLRALPLVAVSLLFKALNERYESEDQIPEYERQQNWVLMIGEGQRNPDPRYPNMPGEKFPIYIKIPKGPMGILLTAPAEAVMQIAWQRGDRSALEYLLDAGKAGISALMPIEPTVSSIIPPGVGTALQMESNRDFFRREDIVPEGEMGRPAEARYDERASKTAIALGQQFHVSPRMIDFAIRDLAGGGGTTATWLADVFLGALGYNPQAPGEVTRRQPTRAEQLSQNPVVGRFIGTRGTEQARRGYEALDAATAQMQRELYQQPEARRLGMGFNAPGQSTTIDGAAYQLTPQQREQIVQQSTPLIRLAWDELTAGAMYQSANDAQRRQMLDTLRDKVIANAREQVTGQISGYAPTPWDETDARLLVQAMEEYMVYQSIPAYIGLTEEQQRMASEASSKISALRRANPNLPMATTRALYARMDPEGARLAQIASQYRNPERKQYWTQHPLLNVYFGELEPEELEMVLPGTMQQMGYPRQPMTMGGYR